MRVCDRAADHVISYGGASYEAALNAEGECEKTANTLVNFRFGNDVGLQFQDPLNNAVATCWAAYDAKTRGLAALALAGTPQTTPDAGPQTDFGQIEAKVKACVAGLQQKAQGLGFKTSLDVTGGT
jgi:hypothetical protein